MSFGERLKKLRGELNLTQAELAEKVGVSRATIAGYETKGKEPPYDTLVQLADTLKCSTDYLLGYSTERISADRIKETIPDYSHLASLYREISGREDLKTLLKEAKSLKPEMVNRVIEIIRILKDEN